MNWYVHTDIDYLYWVATSPVCDRKWIIYVTTDGLFETNDPDTGADTEVNRWLTILDAKRWCEINERRMAAQVESKE